MAMETAGGPGAGSGRKSQGRADGCEDSQKEVASAGASQLGGVFQMSLRRWSPGSAQSPGDAVEAWAGKGALASWAGLSVLTREEGSHVRGRRAETIQSKDGDVPPHTSLRPSFHTSIPGAQWSLHTATSTVQRPLSSQCRCPPPRPPSLPSVWQLGPAAMRMLPPPSSPLASAPYFSA